MSKLMKTQFAYITLLTLMFGGFQNCSQPSLQFEDLQSTTLITEFDYDYESKPGHFLQTVLLLKPAPNPSNAFDIKIYVGTPISEASVGQVVVTVSDPLNRPLCLTDTLDLSTGVREWTVNCVPPVSFSEAIVTLTLTGTSGDYVYQKLYSLD